MKPVSAWLQALENGHWPESLGSAALEMRKNTIIAACRAYIDAYGDAPVLISRAPGRINLRGMHVDTHGGYLNLMTHQREVVVVAGKSPDANTRMVNVDSSHAPIFRRANEGGGSTGWNRYVAGVEAALASRFGAPAPVQAAVASALPEGSALSSSAALCVALINAYAALSHIAPGVDDLILMARQAEWHAGARTGTSDQAAVVLCGAGELVNAALLAEDFSTATARRIAFPDALRVLVIESCTTRNLSGSALLAYTRNRFAYSAGLSVLRNTLRHQGWGDEEVSRFDRLSRILPEAFGGPAGLYRLIQRIPQRVSLEELIDHYGNFDASKRYEESFGGLPQRDRPREFALRAPLLFALSESQRARVFLDLIQAGRFEQAGRLMCIGHDGDRVKSTCMGWPTSYDDDALDLLAEAATPLELVTGYYGASSLVLDGIVDAALSAGALGASLTGAGIAGSVIALCKEERTPALRQQMVNYLASSEYAALLKTSSPTCDMSIPRAERCVWVNDTVPGAGLIAFR